MFPNKQPRLSAELEEDAEQNTNENDNNGLLLPQDQTQPPADLPELMIVSPIIQELPLESYEEMPALIAESNSPPGRAENETYLLDDAAGVAVPEISANNNAEANKSQTKSLKRSRLETELTKPLLNKKPRLEIPEVQEGPSTAEPNVFARMDSVPKDNLSERIKNFFKTYKFKNDHAATNELKAKKPPTEYKLEGRNISELEKELTKLLHQKEPIPKPVAPGIQGASGSCTTVHGSIFLIPEDLLHSYNEFSSPGDSSVVSDLSHDEELPDAKKTAPIDKIAKNLQQFFESIEQKSKNGQAAANELQAQEPPIEDEAEGRNISELEKELAKPLPIIEPIPNPEAPEIQEASGSSTAGNRFISIKTRIIAGGNTANKIENMLFISEDLNDSGDESSSSSDFSEISLSSNDHVNEEPAYVILGPHTFTVVQAADSSDSTANRRRRHYHVHTGFENVQEEDVSSTIPGDEDEDEDMVD